MFSFVSELFLIVHPCALAQAPASFPHFGVLTNSRQRCKIASLHVPKSLLTCYRQWPLESPFWPWPLILCNVRSQVFGNLPIYTAVPSRCQRWPGQRQFNLGSPPRHCRRSRKLICYFRPGFPVLLSVGGTRSERISNRPELFLKGFKPP